MKDGPERASVFLFLLYLFIIEALEDVMEDIEAIQNPEETIEE